MGVSLMHCIMCCLFSASVYNAMHLTPVLALKFYILVALWHYYFLLIIGYVKFMHSACIIVSSALGSDKNCIF
jgi:hypothetical protein